MISKKRRAKTKPEFTLDLNENLILNLAFKEMLNFRDQNSIKSIASIYFGAKTA